MAGKGYKGGSFSAQTGMGLDKRPAGPASFMVKLLSIHYTTKPKWLKA